MKKKGKNLNRSCTMIVLCSLGLAGHAGEARLEAADKKTPPAEAAMDDRQNASLAAEGVIERYILDPRGEVEGLLLADGSHMYVTSRAEDRLIRALAPGDHVRVYGRRKLDQGLVQPDVIKNLTRGTSFVVPLRLDLPMQEQELHLAVTEMSASGKIRRLLFHGMKGIVHGFVLSDETQVRLPLDTNEEFRRSLHIGDSVAVRGNGTANRFGRALEAVAMGKDSTSLISLDASLRRLP